MSEGSSDRGEGQTPAGPLSDTDLLAALQLREASALETLYDRYAGMVMAIGLRILCNRAAAEQLVETIFFDLWKHADSFTGPVLNGLVSRARTLAIQRRRSPNPPVDRETADAFLCEPSGGAAETSDLRWNRARTQQSLRRVSDDARQIVEMICLDGWDVVEVARRLNLTPLAVRQRLASGMRALGDALRIEPLAAHPIDQSRIPLVNLDRVRVLVVDDEPDARRALARSLQAVGAFVTAVNSVGEAMAALSQTNPEVLLSDLAMPDEDGFDLIRKVRRAGRTVRDLPAIALTAFADGQTRRDAMLAGFQRHVAKPVDPHELAEVVASLVGRTGAVPGWNPLS